MTLSTTLRQNVKNVDRKWYIIDAKGQTLGSLAVLVAKTLRGKDRVDFTPHVDGGDYVVVLNTKNIEVTGKKEEQKKYYRHSGYLGHLKQMTLKEKREKDPSFIIKNAISGMLPKNRHRKQQLRRLFLFEDEQHAHLAQNPIPLNIT